MNGLVYSLKPLKPKGKKITMHRNNLKKYVQRKSLVKSSSEIITNTNPLITCSTQVKSNAPKPKLAKKPIIVDTVKEVGSTKTEIISTTTTKQGRGRPPKLASSKFVNSKLNKRLVRTKAVKPILLRRTPPRVAKNKNICYK
jgi:hypothetical protein